MQSGFCLIQKNGETPEVMRISCVSMSEMWEKIQKPILDSASHVSQISIFGCLIHVNVNYTVNETGETLVLYGAKRFFPGLCWENPCFMLGKPLFSQLFQINAEKILALC